MQPWFNYQGGQGTNSVKHIARSNLWVGGYPGENHELPQGNNSGFFHDNCCI